MHTKISIYKQVVRAVKHGMNMNEKCKTNVQIINIFFIATFSAYTFYG